MTTLTAWQLEQLLIEAADALAAVELSPPLEPELRGPYPCGCPYLAPHHFDGYDSTGHNVERCLIYRLRRAADGVTAPRIPANVTAGGGHNVRTCSTCAAASPGFMQPDLAEHLAPDPFTGAGASVEAYRG